MLQLHVLEALFLEDVMCDIIEALNNGRKP
jgi:hypothetical protein